jgi:hypothetical protein
MRRQLLVSLLFSTAAMAQVVVQGEVVRKSTGEPLAGVRVGQTVTDAAGRFYLNSLPAGSSAILLFDGPGLLPRRQVVTIEPKDTLVVIRVPMTPQAVIAGKVLDENGWPVAKASVTAAQYGTYDGVRQWQPVRGVSTDDRGEYRIGKLPPGRYYIYVRPLSGVPWSDYQPAWYPSGFNVAAAHPIDLREGQEASGTDVHLAMGGGVEVRGRVTLPDGYRQERASLEVTWQELGTINGAQSVPIAADGSFTLRHLPPRQYTFTASTGAIIDSSAPPKYLAVRTLDVSDRNIDGITLNVGPTVIRDLKGTVVREGAFDPGEVHIQLQRATGAVQLRAKVEPDGSFVIPGVWPGRYYASVSAQNGMAVSFRFGGREALHRQIDFDGTDTPLRVTIRERGAYRRITGTLTDSSQHPVSGANLIFVPSGLSYSSFQRATIPSVGTDQNGAFTVQIPGGVYRVYAVEELAAIDESMADPDFLQAQEKAFPPVTIAAGDNPPLKLVMVTQH